MAHETTGFGITVGVTPTAGIEVSLKDVEVTPQGYEGDEKIEQTTNANTRFRSFEPGDLLEKTNISGTAAYDPDDLSDIKAAINVRGIVVVTLKSGRYITDNGWLVSAKPNGMTRGNMPVLAFEIALEGEDASGADNEVVTTPA